MMRYFKRHLKVQPGYGIYLLTMVLSIIIFYVFNALRDSTMIDLLSGYSGDYVIYVELMDQLMHHALDYSKSTVLLSLLPASRQQFGSSYGFTTTYFKARYTLDKTMVSPDTTGISFHFRLEAMKDLYGAFMQRFNGFVVRTTDDFSTLINLARADNGEIIFYYDDNRVMRGYAIMHYQGNKADAFMSRVNDMALMQRLLNTTVDSTVSLYALNPKPGTFMSIE